MHKVYFVDGSFALFSGTYRSWHNPDGTLKACERKLMYRGLPAARAVPARHKNVLQSLEQSGLREVATERHARELAAYRDAYMKQHAREQAALTQRAA